VLLVLLLEALLLGAWHRRNPRVPPLRALLPNLAAGAALVAALRLVHSGAAGIGLLALLLLALLAHLEDLRQRWR
jgi:hypothetical protein